MCLSNNKKSRTWSSIPCVTLIIGNIFWVSLEREIEGSAHVLLGEGSKKNLEMFLLRKR